MNSEKLCIVLNVKISSVTQSLYSASCTDFWTFTNFLHTFCKPDFLHSDMAQISYYGEHCVIWRRLSSIPSVCFKLCTMSLTFLCILQTHMSTAVVQAVACAPVTRRVRVRSPIGTSFLGEVFRGFYSPVRQMSGSFRPPKVPDYHLVISIIITQHSLRAPMTWDVYVPYNLKYTYIQTSTVCVPLAPTVCNASTAARQTWKIQLEVYGSSRRIMCTNLSSLTTLSTSAHDHRRQYH